MRRSTVKVDSLKPVKSLREQVRPEDVEVIFAVMVVERLEDTQLIALGCLGALRDVVLAYVLSDSPFHSS